MAWRVGSCGLVWATAVATALVMSACGSVSSQAVGPVPDVRSYELRGSNQQEVLAEAERLCPKGFDVHRLSGRHERVAGEPQPPFQYLAKVWNHAVGWLDTDTDRAQLAVTCR